VGFQETMQRMLDAGADPDTSLEAAGELEHRLQRTGRRLPPRTRWRGDKRPWARAIPVLKRTVAEEELLIVRALARTKVAGQFFSTPDGQRVFTADTDGYSGYNGRRDELTGLSALLDDVAALFTEWQRPGTGGRFYERDGCFFDAESGKVFVEVDLGDDGDYDEWDDYYERVYAPLRRERPTTSAAGPQPTGSDGGEPQPQGSGGGGFWGAVRRIFGR
jgi:hypothetical protein